MKFSAALAAFVVIAFHCLPASASRVITDEAGAKVTLPDKIERVAVTGVLPFPSVLALYLGSADRIAGIPPSSMEAARSGLLGELFPELLKAETGYASGAGLNIEELMKLRPDVVFRLAEDKVSAETLRNAGLPSVAISVSGWGYDAMRTYSEWIKTLSAVFPERAEVLAPMEKWRRRAEGLAPRVEKSGAERRSVLFVVRLEEGRVVTSGRNFFGQYWCDAAGAINAASDLRAERSNAVVAMEQIYSWDPDVIFITNFTPALPEDIMNDEAWKNVKAVRRGAVYKMPMGAYRTYTPGADVPLTALWIAQKVYPEIFSGTDIRREAIEYYSELFGLKLREKQLDDMFGRSGAR